jgi:hypothetical protein
MTRAAKGTATSAHERYATAGSALLLAVLPMAALGAEDSDGSASPLGTHEYDLGPFRLIFGPQSDGYVGATLKGDKAFLFSKFSGMPPPEKAPTANSTAWFSYGNIDLALDSAWSSAPAAANNATISLKPTVTFGAVRVSPKAPRQLTQDQQAVCDQLNDDMTKAFDAHDTDGQHKAIHAAVKAGCKYLEDPYHDIVAFSVYPTFEYRFGHITQNGQQYQASQALIGGGARVFFPWQLNGWWASWPFVSATYYHAKDNSGSTIPVPAGIRSDYFAAQGKVDVLLPVTLGGHSKALQLSIDLTASKATTGADETWQYMQNIQLLVNLGGTWKPAITYRQGQDRGLTYDKQVIFGLAAEFL